MGQEEPVQDNNGFADLSSLVDEAGSEPSIELGPDQAISDDGQVVELGQNSNDSVTKDI